MKSRKRSSKTSTLATMAATTIIKITETQTLTHNTPAFTVPASETRLTLLTTISISIPCPSANPEAHTTCYSLLVTSLPFLPLDGVRPTISTSSNSSTPLLTTTRTSTSSTGFMTLTATLESAHTSSTTTAIPTTLPTHRTQGDPHGSLAAAITLGVLNVLLLLGFLIYFLRRRVLARRNQDRDRVVGFFDGLKQARVEQGLPSVARDITGTTWDSSPTSTRPQRLSQANAWPSRTAGESGRVENISLDDLRANGRLFREQHTGTSGTGH